jgi:DNA polymerase III epsilon subunit-like protein
MTAAKIVYWDIETSPNLVYTWGAGYEENVIEVVEPWFIISFAYRWEGEPEKNTKCVIVTAEEAIARDDSRVVRALREVLDEADIAVAHNGDHFDKKKFNARLIANDIAPPQPYRTIDTLKVARGNFKFNSNRLDQLGQFLGVGQKVKHTGFKLWKDCMAGDEKALKLMAKYNIGDIKLLRDVYLKLRPYMPNHPNLAVYDNASGCPKCGASSIHLQSRGYRVTNTAKKRTWWCSVCKGWSSTRLQESAEESPRPERLSV